MLPNFESLSPEHGRCSFECPFGESEEDFVTGWKHVPAGSSRARRVPTFKASQLLSTEVALEVQSCSVQLGSVQAGVAPCKLAFFFCKLFCARCSAHVALRKLLCASCSVQVAMRRFGLSTVVDRLFCTHFLPLETSSSFAIVWLKL